MMILETVTYTTEEGGPWTAISLTAGEIIVIKDYLNTIVTPVSGGTINLSTRFRFFPDRWIHSITFGSKDEASTWDTVNGWRQDAS